MEDVNTLQKYFKQLKETDNIENLRKLSDFIYYEFGKQVIVDLLKEEIAKLPKKEKNGNSIDIGQESRNELYLFPLLTLFGTNNHSFFRLTLPILFEYLDKEPSFSDVLNHYFCNDIAFHPDSYLNNYQLQIDLIDFLFERANDFSEGKSYDYNYLYRNQIFIFASAFFNNNYKKSIKEFFVLFPLKGEQAYSKQQRTLLAIKKRLWEFYFTPHMQIKSHSFFTPQFNISLIKKFKNENYITEEFSFIKNILEQDAQYIFKLYSLHSINCRKDTALIYKIFIEIFPKQEYVNLFYSLEMDALLKEYFIFNWKYINKEKANNAQFTNEFEVNKEKEITEYVKNYKFQDFYSLLNRIIHLINDFENDKKDFYKSITVIFDFIILTNIEMAMALFKKTICNLGDILSTQTYKNLINSNLVNETQLYDTINKWEYSEKFNIKQSFFSSISENKISRYFYDQLFDLYKNPYRKQKIDFSFWINYKMFNPDIFISFFSHFMAHQKPSVMLFFDIKNLYSTYRTEFSKNSSLLLELVKYRQKTDVNFEISNKLLNEILEFSKTKI